MTKTIDALVEALEAEKAMRLYGQSPECGKEHWESIRERRRAVYEATDAALAQARAEQAEPVGHLRVMGRLHDYQPGVSAFDLPDGKHAIYTTPPAAPVAKLEPWQPIETAPKDGTMFLGWVSAERWSHSDDGGCGLSHDTSQIEFCRWDKGLDGNGYFDPFCGQIGDLQAVTHWIPIPPPPGEAAHNAKLGNK